MENKYIYIIQTKKHEKTEEYTVVNRKSGTPLGWIKWYGAWRQYCFFPWFDSVFNIECLKFVSEYIEKLMEERKK